MAILPDRLRSFSKPCPSWRPGRGLPTVDHGAATSAMPPGGPNRPAVCCVVAACWIVMFPSIALDFDGSWQRRKRPPFRLYSEGSLLHCQVSCQQRGTNILHYMKDFAVKAGSRRIPPWQSSNHPLHGAS